MNTDTGNGFAHNEHIETGYTMISNALIRNTELTPLAKCVLIYMLSCSGVWKFSKAGIMSILGISKYAINSVFSELKEKGYLKIERTNKPGSLYEYSYHYSDAPIYIKNPDV